MRVQNLHCSVTFVPNLRVCLVFTLRVGANLTDNMKRKHLRPDQDPVWVDTLQGRSEPAPTAYESLNQTEKICQFGEDLMNLVEFALRVWLPADILAEHNSDQYTYIYREWGKFGEYPESVTVADIKDLLTFAYNWHAGLCTAPLNSGHSLNQDCGIISTNLKGGPDGETKTKNLHPRVYNRGRY